MSIRESLPVGFDRALRLAGLAGLLLGAAASSDLRAAAGERTRQVLRETYRYGEAAPEAATGAPPAAEGLTMTEGDPDALTLPVFEVDARAVPRGLEQAIARAPVAPKRPGKLGTGVIQKDFGKVRMQAVTVLYVPIFVGFSW